MCGIAGIFATRDAATIDTGLLARMNQAQFHRGPDAGDVHIEPGVGLAHRRLAIIDLSGGAQPLYNEDESVVIVYNGEIYDYQPLVDELKAAGHVFRTHSDTEVIVHAWEQWGPDCVQRFRGMFAFAIWDRNRQTLFIARDRLGIKPLYYAELADGRLLFGSELKALLACRELPRGLDPCAVEDYFALGYIPEPRSIFSAVKKLPPGHHLTIRRGERVPAPVQYWDLKFQSNGVSDFAEAQAELIERLRHAIDIRMVAEVPLGAFLSGGVDSSAVVAMMAGLDPKPVQTCAIGFSVPSFDETRYAEEVAGRYHTDHRTRMLDPDDYGLIDRLATLYDEPFADSSAMPTYRVCELARERVTVALSGDGGDEGFGGYRRYRWHMLEEKMRAPIPRAIRRPLFGALGAVYPKLDWAPRVLRGKSTFQALARDAVEGYVHNFSLLPDTLRSRMYSDRLKSQLGGYHVLEVFKRHLENAPDHPLSQVQYLDYKLYIPGDILTKVDRASMAHSLEVRVPVLDHPFIEWAAGLPPDWKLHNGEGKHILKKALEPYLPNDVLYRKKMGFAVPLAEWFRGPLKQKVRDALLGETLADTGLFERAMLEHLVDHHQRGLRDYSAALWSLLMFESFCRQRLAA